MIEKNSSYSIKNSVRTVLQKMVEMKSYSPSGSFIGIIQNSDIVSFTNSLNSGFGECVVTVSERFDSGRNDIQLGNRVDIFVSDRNTAGVDQTYVRIYSGYISSVEPEVGDSAEKITIRLLGFQTRLGLDVLKNGTRTFLGTKTTDGLQTDETSATPADIGAVVRAIVNRYVAETDSSFISPSDTDNIPDIGESMTYSFNEKTYAEAIEKCRSVSPSGTYWRVDADGVVHFGSSHVEHKIFFGKHCSNLFIKKNIEQVRNVLLVSAPSAGPLFKSYSDEGSIERYGRRIERMSDTGIVDSATADLVAQRFLEDNADPIVRIECDIIDDSFADGYDIESLSPGDSVTFFNLSSDISSALKENMIITNIVYSFSQARITVEPSRSGILDIQERLKRNVIESQSTTELTYVE